MTPLSDLELLTVWEAAQATHPAARGAHLLRALGDDAPESLPIGARDRALLAHRERWFGPHFETVADCPQCGTTAELTFETPPITPAASSMRRITAGGANLEYRLPDTRDLLAIADCSSVAEARQRLAARCVDGEVTLAPEIIDAIAVAMSEADPDGDLRVAITCPDCGHAWDAVFDPASHFWSEVEASALRVLREVDALATAYGWSEREILSLPLARRRAYLGMVTS
jgi:hypothetical protein